MKKLIPVVKNRRADSNLSWHLTRWLMVADPGLLVKSADINGGAEGRIGVPGAEYTCAKANTDIGV